VNELVHGLVNSVVRCRLSCCVQAICGVWEAYLGEVVWRVAIVCDHEQLVE